MDKVLIAKHLNIKLEQVEKGIDKIIFRDLNLSIVKGGISAIVGMDKPASSILLRTLAGIENKFTGEVNRDLKIGYLPSKNFIFPWLNVLENITFGVSKNDNSRADEIIDFVGLGGYENHYPDKKSFGFLFRIAFGRMLFNGFDLILLDNSLNEIQIKSKNGIYDLLNRSAYNLKKTILVTTENKNEVEFLSQNVFSYTPDRLLIEI